MYSAKMYLTSLLITQLWKLIFRKLKTIESNRFHILNPIFLAVLQN